MGFDERYGYIHSCPTNLGTGMRASVHVTLPGWHKAGIKALQKRCEALGVQPRGTRGESGGHIDDTYDISNKHRLGYSEVELVQNMINAVNTLLREDEIVGTFPEIKSKHSLVAKHVTAEKWAKYSKHVTKTSNFTLEKAIAVSTEFDNQHCGIYAGDWDSYKDFSEVFDPIIQEYHGITADAKHTSDMDGTKIKGKIPSKAPVNSTRIRVGRNLEGFGLSPGILKEHRVAFEGIMKQAFQSLEGDLAGTYYPLTGMDETTRQQLVDDHFLFMSGDRNLIVAGMERDWPEGRGIFHNKDKTFLVWVNEEDQLRIISMQQGSDVKAVFDRLARGIKAVEDSIYNTCQKKFMFDERYGYIHSCPTNLGTGMRASVHVTLPGWHKAGIKALQRRCEELGVQPRGTRGESGGHVDDTYDISNKHRLGYSEVELVQNMINAVNTLLEEDKIVTE